MLVNKLVCSKSDVLSHMTEENTPASNRITNCIRIISSGTKPTNYTLFLREVGPGRARLDSDMKICGSPSMIGTRHSNTYTYLNHRYWTRTIMSAKAVSSTATLTQ